GFIQPAVKDIEFFANLSDPLQSWRLVCTGIPHCFELLLEQVYERSRLKTFYKWEGRLRFPFCEFQVHDVFVNLIFVPAEGHAHFIEADVSTERFHLLDCPHIELLRILNTAV